jgi:hypothetical protein
MSKNSSESERNKQIIAKLEKLLVEFELTANLSPQLSDRQLLRLLSKCHAVVKNLMKQKP